MAKSAIITLTTAGADTGPFNLLSDVDSYVNPFETNVAKSSLVAGYTTNLVPDAATIVRVQSSSSLCTNFIDLTYPVTTTTTSTTTTTTTANPSGSLFFDASTGVGGYSVTAIDVNGVTPTLTSGTNVPFSTDGHGYDTNQTGTNETLNISIGGFTLNGCIQVTDSDANYYQQNVTGNGTISFTGLAINNTTTVQIILADGAC
jgi:hypothetical protein